MLTIISPKIEKRKKVIKLVGRFILTALGMLAFLAWTGQTFPY